MRFVANKKFRLSAEDIEPGVAPEEGCLATDRIVVDGRPVGYMYRDGLGWVFTAGDETPEYLDDRGHLNVMSLNDVANFDRSIVPYLHAPPGSAFIRHLDGFVEDPEGAPREPAEPSPQTSIRSFPLWTATTRSPRTGCSRCPKR